ncbi:hypothetical protein [Desulfovibrio legallii]|uniref:hypothetical protein n=1 Tax=Desulfovibrio legallii TaxID=571438 RepID=UPI0013EF29E1|nr:hypothetical protein [Desulfovibrio legallii]
MSITLYTAPECIRCKIVKAFLAERDIPYATVDFKADAQEFNAFYRANRKAIYRNPEGVEFPLFNDGQVIKQGSGEIIAYLLSGHVLEACITRSDLLHGKIGGIYPSQCPDGQEENLCILVDRLAAGGLEVWLQTDGRKPDLLERLLAIKNVKAVLNAVGGAATTAAVYGGAPDTAALAASIGLVRDIPGGGVRFLAMPLPGADGQWTWPRREDARDAAQMVAEAYGQPTLPYRVEALPPDAAVDLHGLEPLPEQNLLLYRSAARQFLYKAEIGK